MGNAAYTLATRIYQCRVGACRSKVLYLSDSWTGKAAVFFLRAGTMFVSHCEAQIIKLFPCLTKYHVKNAYGVVKA